MYHISRHTVSKYIEGDPEKLACTERRDTINFDSLRNYTVKEAYSEAVKLGYNGKRTQFYKE